MPAGLLPLILSLHGIRISNGRPLLALMAGRLRSRMAVAVDARTLLEGVLRALCPAPAHLQRHRAAPKHLRRAASQPARMPLRRPRVRRTPHRWPRPRVAAAPPHAAPERLHPAASRPARMLPRWPRAGRTPHRWPRPCAAFRSVRP
ncbi:hypothetical protein PVAP13_9NG597114 [Panicum virgatum]|uniref:Uncharacterized protein n=1 Tax=Panicum virgatum TaxID=38727 RepID=A0A8T0MV36_PANVG|nr:hypothetical protein PVAP13_9NG597114 [Panicum virgatum]